MSRRSVTATALILTATLISPAAGRSQSEPAAAKVEVSATVPAGTRNYAPGTWGTVEVGVVNRSDQPAKVLSTLHFRGEANEQFGRELWMPPRSRRRTAHPVFVPPDVGGAKSLVFESLVYDRTTAEERLVPSPDGRTLADGLLPVDTEAPITGWIGPAETADRPASVAREMVAAARIGIGLPPKVAGIRGLALPSEAETWQGIQHLVLSGDRALNDAAGLTAIRNWVQDGGRLWIILNETPPELVERILGDDCGIQAVDRVGLTSVRIEAVPSQNADSDREAREFERPVELVRVLVEGVEVIHTVDGWPASFRRTVGRGEVLCTTLSAEAWVRPPGERDSRARSVLGAPPWAAGEPLTSLASRFFRAAETPPDEAGIWQPLLTEKIGHRIVGRRTVLAILALSCGTLAAAAVWVGRRGRLERLLWIAPLVSVAAAGALAAVGSASTGSLESSVAEGQFVRTFPGATEAHVSGLAAFYSRESDEVNLGSDAGGVLSPDMSGFGGATRRMIWTDWDRWHWENLKLPSGVRFAPLRKHMTLPTPAAALGEFGPEGLSGQVSGPLQGLEDAVIAAPSGERIALRLTGAGRFAAGDDDRLAAGAFVSGSLLTDAQRGRQDVLRRLFAGGGGVTPLDARPVLFTWARPLDLGFIYPKESVRVGDALVSLPLEFRRAPPGTPVVIPSPFVRLEPASVREGLPPSMLFEKRTGRPVEYSSDIESWARFRMPAPVVPMEIDEARIEIEVSGAAGRLELLRRSDGREEPLQAWENPAGTLRFTARGGALPAVDDAGGFLLGVRVRAAEQPAYASSAEPKPYWRVTSFRVGATGRTRGEARE